MYWRGLIREAGWDITTIGKKAEDKGMDGNGARKNEEKSKSEVPDGTDNGPD